MQEAALIEESSQVGKGMELLFSEEQSDTLKDNNLFEIVAEIENEDFEPLEPFEDEEESSFSLLPNFKPVAYRAAGALGGICAGLYSSFMLKTGSINALNESVSPDPFDPLIGLGIMVGGGIAGIKLGKKLGGSFKHPGSTDYIFISKELDGEFQEEVYDLIRDSDLVVEISADDDLDLVEKEYPEPSEAADTYKSAMDILEEKESFWEDRVFLADYEPVGDEMKAIIESYRDDEIDASRLSESIKANEEIMEEQQELVKRNLEALEENEVTAFLKYNKFDTTIEAEDTESFDYNGFAYEIEIFQGEDRVFTLDGVYSEEPNQLLS